MKKPKECINLLAIVIIVILLIGGVYIYSKKSTNIRDGENTSNLQAAETRNFRLYRKYDRYVYLVDLKYPGLVYYKSNEVDKFEKYNELDYLQITANSYSDLNVTEKQYTGIRDYSVDVTRQINHISDIRKTSETIELPTYYQGSVEDVAQNYVKTHSVEGIEFTLEKTFEKEPFVIFSVVPDKTYGGSIDSARIILRKSSFGYEVIAFGTAFPELEGKYPELEGHI